ncbi:YraN family protein [Streptomyces sp. AC495_CC817]|uniref:YraN family protein n=1 Tax=Streptomyces sp. AC495_CC817 TaxID=2823900 RepID=UPI001C271924|nr:YraN family protein [Streptomyces sp. AC495_CC817]
MAAKDVLGRAGEDRAVRHLIRNGYDVVDRNWRCDQGEIDIVAVWRDVLVFVEVKTRTTDAFGHPFEAVDTRKRRRLWQLAHAWIRVHPDQVHGRGIRIDAIAVTGADARTGVLEHLTDLL